MAKIKNSSNPQSSNFSIPHRMTEKKILSTIASKLSELLKKRLAWQYNREAEVKVLDGDLADLQNKIRRLPRVIKKFSGAVTTWRCGFFTASDSGKKMSLRLRRLKDSRQDNLIVTLKGPSEKSNFFKIKAEYEICLPFAKNIVSKIIRALKLSTKPPRKKLRTSFAWSYEKQQVHFDFDTFSGLNFLEIETHSVKNLRAVLKKLKILLEWTSKATENELVKNC
jgi:adenylate cyclase class IV